MNLFEEHAREKAEAQPEWKLFHWECFPKHGKILYFEVTGAVCLEKYKRGPKKGYTNWSKRSTKTEKTVVLPIAEHNDWCNQWEEKTGLCQACTGEGKTFASWSRDEGSKFRPCSSCHGTGLSPKPKTKRIAS